MISIIIPTYNEQDNIVQLLSELENLKGQREIIVVDGGSSDDTIQLAKQKAKVICLPCANRARQMNQGAEAAKGKILWFVHADSIPSHDSLKLINEVLEESFYGGFSLSFDSSKISFKTIAFLSNLRARYLGLIFGDQAMFVRKNFFFQLGGFSNIKLMEDFDFCQRAKKIVKPTLLSRCLQTSSRRFLKGGIWKTFFVMQYIKILYLCGTNSKKLKQIYSYESTHTNE